jgi:DNA-binding transcriptional LysR family regulator
MLVWDDLRVFLHIARERTLSGAARRLRVDQSTMSRRLAALEASTKTRLFDRTPSGYALSAAGEAVLENLQNMEAEAAAIERKLVGQDARLEGRVRLATSDSFAAWFLLRHVTGLRERHPGIVLELVTGNQTADLARRDADLSLRLTKPTQPNLIARRIGQGAWAVYAAKTYLAKRGVPELRRGFAGHDLVAFDEELGGTLGARWLRVNAAQGRVVLSSNSLICQAAAVLSGLGVSALPCVLGDVERGLVRLPPGVIGHHDIWLVVHPDVRGSARVRAVMDSLVELIEAQSPLLAGKAPPLKPRKPPKRRTQSRERGALSRR